MKYVNRECPVSEEQIHWMKNNDNRIGIRVLGRGDVLFYKKNDKWFTCEMSAIKSIIGIQIVKKWNDDTPLSSEDKEEAIKLISVLYKKHYGEEPVIV